MLMDREQDAILTFDMVVERLLEAWGFLRRMPDRESSWLRSPGVTSLYRREPQTIRDVWREWGYEVAVEVAKAAAAVPPSLPGLRSAEVDRMNEALGWIEWVEPRDRRLVGMVLAQLDRGAARPDWGSLVVDLASDVGPDALRKRFGRAVSRIAFKANR